MIVPVSVVPLVNSFRSRGAFVDIAVVILAIVACAWLVESEKADVLAHRGYPPWTVLTAVSDLIPVGWIGLSTRGFGVPAWNRYVSVFVGIKVPAVRELTQVGHADHALSHMSGS